MERPETKYAKAGDLCVAYQVTGEGPIDVINVPQWTTHLEADWEIPEFAGNIEAMSRFAHFIRLDQLGAGMSDPLPGGSVASIDAWLDSMLAVMDAEGLDTAALTGHSWGGTLAIAFAAMHPDRVRALVIHGATARSMAAPDYRIGLPEEMRDRAAQIWTEWWGTGRQVELTFPEGAEDPLLRRRLARYEKLSASPGVFRRMMEEVFFELDVRDLLPHVRAPTLILHSAEDRFIRPSHGRYVADHIPGARYEEIPGSDHYMLFGDAADQRLQLTREFLTGTDEVPTRHERVLATLLFTDIVGSTERAAEIGDEAWRRVLDAHDAVMRRSIDAHGGQAVKQTGDGFLARFDAPARAIRCALAAKEALHGMGITIRAAVHTGEVELRGDDVGGLGVHVAARVLESAGAGGIATSSTVRDLTIGSGIGFTELGRRALRGVPGEWTVLLVDDQRTSA